MPIKSKEIKTFSKSLIIFVLILIALDWGIGSLLRHYFFTQKSGLQHRINYTINKTNADLLIIGSSRATYHYNALNLEKGMHLSSYNCGIHGNGIVSHNAVLSCILERYIPKIVILDINKNELTTDTDSYDRLSYLLPYYKQHPELGKVLELRSKYEKIKLFSQTYPFNSLLIQILYGNMELPKGSEDKDVKGYLSLKSKWNQPIVNDTNNLKGILDQNKINAFKKFIFECKKLNIKLYIFVSPFYAKSNGNGKSIEYVSGFAKKNDIPFVNHYQDSLFMNNPEYFNDIEHLNQQGSEIYTESIYKYILSDLKKKSH